MFHVSCLVFFRLARCCLAYLWWDEKNGRTSVCLVLGGLTGTGTRGDAFSPPFSIPLDFRVVVVEARHKVDQLTLFQLRSWSNPRCFVPEQS